MKPGLVEVTWLDAQRTDDTVTGFESIGVTRRTVGWLLRDDAAGVIVAMTLDETNYERGFLIPRAYVQTTKKLRYA